MSEDGPYTREDVLKLLQSSAFEERNRALFDACKKARKTMLEVRELKLEVRELKCPKCKRPELDEKTGLLNIRGFKVFHGDHWWSHCLKCDHWFI